MKLHREGFGILWKLFVLLVLVNAALLCFQPSKGAILSLGALSLILYFLVLNFFRLPKRYYQGDTHNVVIAPADGRIVAIEEVYENEYFQDKRLQISIFMSVFNVHANWYPVSGKVMEYKHHNGNFMAAYLPKSSTENERSTVVIALPDGREVLTRQVAGALARRIVTYARKGDSVSVNDQMGFIKFGSRVDIYLPLDAKVKVHLGEKVVATQTLLAML